MTRAAAIANAEKHFDSGQFVADLARRVAIPSTSQEPEFRPALYEYLDKEMRATLEAMGYTCALHENPVEGGGPVLIAERHEGDDLPTVLTYGHADTVRGLDEQWREGLSPWTLVQEGDRLYGRGTADNKGQHSINIAAIDAVLKARGRLGFNSRIFLETSEETGSRGLREVAETHRDALSADVLIGSDGPRLVPESPTIFMGTRGAMNFSLSLDLREGGHHSGNWGGLLANPGVILMHAIASIIDRHGAVQVPGIIPEAMPNSVRMALADCRVDGGPDAPAIDPDWGQPGLTPVERVFGWNTFEVLAFKTGNPDKVVNAIPPSARAWCQIRFTVDRDPATFLPAIREHLRKNGFEGIKVESDRDDFVMQATRLLPDHPWVQWAKASVAETMGQPPMIVPNLGGSLPNDVFTSTIGVPTLWFPHSYSACSQHAPNEHLLASIAREGLRMMAGVFWDVGEPGTPR
jgi:acetylornithine deacetylase/succinyl-diaminopimelate desuccinylase-like protein